MAGLKRYITLSNARLRESFHTFFAEDFLLLASINELRESLLAHSAKRLLKKCSEEIINFTSSNRVYNYMEIRD
jgi:hypothetical protein